jgi:hypothetical protein
MLLPSNKDREKTDTVHLSVVGRLSIPCCNFLHGSPSSVDEPTISFYAALVVELERAIKQHAALQIETTDPIPD